MEFDFNSLFAFIIFGVTIGVVYGMVALGISLIYSGLDIVHFAHGEIYMFGAFFGLVLAKDMSIPYPAALIGAMILAGLMGMLIERVFYRRLTRSGGGYTVAGMGMIICGFGMSVALMNVAFLIWGADAEPFSIDLGMPLQIADIYIPQSYLLTAVVSFALMGLLHFFLKYTKIGLAVRAVAQNKDIAYLMGINVPVFISLIFGLACALAAAAGVLIGPMQSVQVEMGYLMLMKAFAAAVVGGFGSLPGALLGGILVGIFENLGAAYISPSHKDIYAFLLLILVLMIRPSGLFGIEAKVKA
ncbi:MAG: branched-chain amino acid ABC transporter permease [Deltaproteobacteria bacterium]|jgi:branched-chain amino acid transport system permease protein|nr:branched-chain amino acid ABC transporter permease [SAR324 cluster bacterium]MEC7347875.1 branched-chain amino acid ABC transporter permease [SAR324 cluster bacterium]MEC7684111.1 branched-chain amino acid ABC transporter permease [SAR324 cluster bacterium]MEC8393696.1 branched-chain amino acid ABC transporter permease [SAR324 cluster bacterium]MEC8686378.1 branched-chain amino acid ABC transporter permease [SAR324 cluster bacterium]